MKYGRDDWIRTSDPLTPSQVRYQTAPHPDAKQLAERGTGADAAAWGGPWSCYARFLVVLVLELGVRAPAALFLLCSGATFDVAYFV